MKEKFFWQILISVPITFSLADSEVVKVDGKQEARS